MTAIPTTPSVRLAGRQPKKGTTMKRLVLASIISLVALAGPLATQPWANDAHHPEKAGSSKTAPAKAKQKKPATKAEKPKQGETRLGLQVHWG
jgi:hypothetical protein